MKAIISNGRRSQIFSNQIDLTEITSFVAKQFPRMKNTQLSFKDLQGNSIPINSNQDIQILKKIYSGQNFVELSVTGLKSGGEKRLKNGSCDKKKIGHVNRKERRTFVLSKVYGGDPKDYEQFESENVEIPLGKLIKKFAQANNIENFKEGSDKITRIEKRNRVFKKIFGQAQSEKYEKFFQQNKDLRLGQLIKKYCQINGKTDFWPSNKEQCVKRKQRVLQKLAKFFDKSKEEFESLVNENPGLRFRQLINILINKGVQVDKAKLQQFRREQRNLRQSRKQDKRTKSQEEKCLKPSSKPKSKSKSKGKKSLQKEKILEEQSINETKDVEKKSHDKVEKNMNSKGQILKEMKELFGKDNVKEYVVFINQNYELGQVGIIEKWFDQSSQ